MRRLLAALALTVSLVACAAAAGAATVAPVFRDLSPAGVEALPARNEAWNPPLPRHFRALEVDVAALEAQLALAPLERSALAASAPLVLALPYPDGTDRRFRVEESSLLEPGLAAKFPDIRTFVAQGIDDPSATARLSLTALGFHAMVLSTAGTVLVDPYARWDARYALSYWKRDGRAAPGAPFHCDVDGAEGGDLLAGPPVEAPPQVAVASGTQLRTYRLALAGTGEYTTAVCAPNPAAVACGLAAMVVSMNRVVGVYEREVAIRMVLVANNNLVVYTNGASDPYSTNICSNTMLNDNVTNLNLVIGSANYDIGHVFSSPGGGIASLNVPCTASKARGCTGTSNPVGDPFDIDYVAHEMGHQFGGAHTFNGTNSSCSGNRSASSAYEPGSGSTIMAYAGICGIEDLQLHSDDTFHVRSFDQIVAFSTGATGSSCAAITATGNTPPTVNAGAAYTIPKQTPFTLTGSATDPDPDTLTYMWEELDLGTATNGNSASPDFFLTGDLNAVRPIFRSFVPLSVPSRTFPKWSDILDNVLFSIGEWMSTRNRTMTFRLTARDNRSGGGGVNWAATTVTVNATAGPFLVTQPNTALTWPGNSLQSVLWDVAGTDAAPISCANVAIDLSTDGGSTFPIALAASTPNDGTEMLTVPNAPTTQARVRVSCAGNVFFDVSNVDFTIDAALPQPNLASISPAIGPVEGGTEVELVGTDFVNGATVMFQSLPATSVTFNSSTSITAVTPAQGPVLADVTVANPDTQTDTLVGAFNYVVNAVFGDGFETGTTELWDETSP